MKYWNELTQVENELIEMDMLLSSVRSLSQAMEAGIELSDIRNCIWLIERKFETINEDINANFQCLWESVRNDSFKEIETQIQSETIDELNKVMDTWAKT